MGLNKCLGIDLYHLLKTISVSVACLSADFNVIMTFDNRLTNVLTALL